MPAEPVAVQISSRLVRSGNDASNRAAILGCIAYAVVAVAARVQGPHRVIITNDERGAGNGRVRCDACFSQLGCHGRRLAATELLRELQYAWYGSSGTIPDQPIVRAFNALMVARNDHLPSGLLGRQRADELSTADQDTGRRCRRRTRRRSGYGARLLLRVADRVASMRKGRDAAHSCVKRASRALNAVRVSE